MVGFGLGLITCIVNQKIQLDIFVFNEVNFPKWLMVGVVILRVTSFVAIKIVGFNLVVAEVGDLAVSIWHLGFCIQVVVWLKTRAQFDGW